MALGLGALFQNLLKLGGTKGAQASVGSMAQKMFGSQRRSTDEVIELSEEERRQRALEFVGAAGPDYYQDPIDDAPNIVMPAPLIQQTSTSSILPQQTIVPQIIEAPRGTVVKGLGNIVLEIERINTNISAITRAMSESALLEKRYRDEMIKDRRELLAQRGKARSRRRTGRRARLMRNVFSPVRSVRRRAGGALRQAGELGLLGAGLEIGAFVADAFKKFMDGDDEATSAGDKSTPNVKGTEDLFGAISGGEGGLDSVNRGKAGDTPGGVQSVLGKRSAELTVDEVLDAMKKGKIFALGKYQITEIAMPGFVQYLKDEGVDTSTAKFNEATQNKYRQYTVKRKRPKVGQYLEGKGGVSENEALLELAAEFASVGVPYDMKAGSYGSGIPAIDIKKGESLYKGYKGAGNAASPDLQPARMLELLRKSKEEASAPPPPPATPPKQQMGRAAAKARQEAKSKEETSAPPPPPAPKPEDPRGPQERASLNVRPSSERIAMAPLGSLQKAPNITTIDLRKKVSLPESNTVNKGVSVPEKDPGGGGLYEKYMLGKDVG